MNNKHAHVSFKIAINVFTLDMIIYFTVTNETKICVNVSKH